MTTSLAALASTPSAHSSNTVLMSPNTITNSTQIIDSAEYDSNLEIKNEFYTREGLWKHVKHGEFVRQQQNSNYTQSQMSGQTNGSNQIANQIIMKKCLICKTFKVKCKLKKTRKYI